MTLILAAVWLLLDYPWGLLAFVAIAALSDIRMSGASYGRKGRLAGRAELAPQREGGSL
jgi:hypothetical protein